MELTPLRAQPEMRAQNTEAAACRAQAPHHPSPACCLTVLRAPGRRLRKAVLRDGTVLGHEPVRHFDLQATPLADLAGLDRLLGRLERCPDRAVARGAVADPARVRGVRRLGRPDRTTGESPTLSDAPRRWIALDVDGLPLPAGTDPGDLAACAAAALALLPAELRGAACVVQATASHGVKPGARLRLWFWCDRPVTGAEAALWFRAAPVDRSVFRPEQMILTAAPVFAPGVPDPVPRRRLLLPGASAVAVPPAEQISPPPPRSDHAPRPRSERAGRYAFAALARAVGRVSAAAEGVRHPTILAEAWGLARLVDARLLDEGDVHRALLAAASRCGMPAAEAEDVVAWAIEHRVGGALAAGAAP